MTTPTERISMVQRINQERGGSQITPAKASELLAWGDRWGLLAELGHVYSEHGRPTASHAGLLYHAHQSGRFDGLETDIASGDSGMIATAKVWVAGARHPFCATVTLSEYSTASGNWTSKPRTMLTKVAESGALRRAFPLGDLALDGDDATEEAADTERYDVDLDTGEIQRPPSDEALTAFSRRIAGATTLEALTEIGSEIERVGAGSDTLRETYRARRVALARTAPGPGPIEGAGELAVAQ